MKLQRGSDTWEMIYDPTASVPAVLLAKNYVDDSTTYMYNVREPEGQLLASFDTAETPNKYYFHFDDLGNTVLITNGSGTVSDSFTYEAWGGVLNSPTDDRKPYQYVGELGYYTHDSDQGTALDDLLQLGVRFYDPDIGRFTQRDPLRHGLNWYRYASARPVVWVDPWGLLEVDGNCMFNWGRDAGWNCDVTFSEDRLKLKCWGGNGGKIGCDVEYGGDGYSCGGGWDRRKGGPYFDFCDDIKDGGTLDCWIHDFSCYYFRYDDDWGSIIGDPGDPHIELPKPPDWPKGLPPVRWPLPPIPWFPICPM